jgi:hypothetical protein
VTSPSGWQDPERDQNHNLYPIFVAVLAVIVGIVVLALLGLVNTSA